MLSRSDSISPSRDRKRSRSPIRRRSRSRSPRRDNKRSSYGYPPPGIKETRGKEYRVYVNNMSYDVKWMNLKDLMKKIGPVEHVEIFTDGDGRSKGCGVVEFNKREDAAAAIKEYDNFEHLGRTLKCREDQMEDSTYYDQLRSQKEKTKAMKESHHMHDRQPPNSLMSGLGGQGGLGGGGLAGALGGVLGNLGGGGGGLGTLGALGLLGNQATNLISFLNSRNGDAINSSVFVSNLDYNVTWQSLKDMFRKAGNCKICNIATEDDSKKSKGYGSAQFETPMEALTAIAMFNGIEMGSARRQIIVRLDRQAQLNHVLQQLGVTEITQATLVQLQSLALLSSMNLNNLGGLGALGGLNNSSLGGMGASAMGGYQNQSNLGAGGSSLGGLGGLGALGGIGNLLGSAGGGGMSGGSSLSGLGALKGMGGSSGGFSGGFGSGGGGSGISSIANYTAGQQLSNYSITGSVSKSSGYSTMDMGGGKRSSDAGTRYGSSDSGTTAKTRVFVRNLPFSMKWQDLKDKFRDAGRIVRADVKTDDQNRSKGCGTVTFETNSEALRAVDQFNGARFEGRAIEVRMDRAVGDR